MKVEVLYFDDCPSYEALLPRLREHLQRVGRDASVEPPLGSDAALGYPAEVSG